MADSVPPKATVATAGVDDAYAEFSKDSPVETQAEPESDEVSPITHHLSPPRQVASVRFVDKDREFSVNRSISSSLPNEEM